MSLMVCFILGWSCLLIVVGIAWRFPQKFSRSSKCGSSLATLKITWCLHQYERTPGSGRCPTGIRSCFKVLLFKEALACCVPEWNSNYWSGPQIELNQRERWDVKALKSPFGMLTFFILSTLFKYMVLSIIFEGSTKKRFWKAASKLPSYEGTQGTIWGKS